MGTFLVYILKSSFCLALFYLFYRLLMSKETFHRFNRCALLGILLWVALLPLAKVGIGHSGEVQQALLALEDWVSLPMDGMPVDGLSGEAAGEVSAIGWPQVLLLVYLLGLAGCLGYQVFSFVRLTGLMRKARREPLAGHLSGSPDADARLLVHDEDVSPFSWMSYVVISRKDLRENGREILLHELAHIKHRHSWDLLLVDVCILFQWFNPAAWLLKQELQTIHEYEADDTVLASGVNARDYQMLLIKKAVGARLYSIANNLNHSSLKKRITMMIKKKSNPWARAKYLYVLPLAAMAVVAFARPEVSNELDEISSVKVNDLTSIVKAEEVKSVENSSKKKIKVSGKVLEARTKMPVVGASVIIKGTTNGTLTDFDGKFSLQAEKGQVILIAFRGYRTQSVEVPENGKPLEIWMKEDSRQLDGISIVGYSNTEWAESEHGKPVSVTDIPEVKYKEVKVDATGGGDKKKEASLLVDEMPEYPGGMQECMKFLAQNITYPESAQKAKMEGRVVVRFFIEADGSITNSEVLRGVSPELDAEALRVVAKMPNWTPGKQRGQSVRMAYSLPIMFSLASQETKQVAQEGTYRQVRLKVDRNATDDDVAQIKNVLVRKGNEEWVVRKNADRNPLIVVNDEVKENMELQDIPVEDVQAICVMKGETAVAQYGEKAKDGAIVVTLRENKEI